MTTEYEDLMLTCVECQEQFLWEKGERYYYQDKGLAEPKRCPECRSARRARLNSGREVRDE